MRPRRVTALALHVLRTSLRSRFVLAMLMLLALVIAVLPANVRGDGTDAGAVRVLFTWTLTPIVLLLSAAVLWAGCSAAACDRGEGRAAGMSVTPLRAFEQWLGEWIGLVLMSALLLSGVLLMLLLQVHRSGLQSTALRPSWRLMPAESGLLEHANAIVQEAVASGRIDAALDPDALLEQVAGRLRVEHLALAPGDEHQWRFEIPRDRFRPGEPVVLTIDFTSPLGAAEQFSARGTVLDAADAEMAEFEIAADDRLQARFELDGERVASTPRVTVRIEHLGDAESSAVLLHAGEGARLLLPVGRFGTNLALAGLVLWALMALLAALGLTCGAMFSLPVAVFVASALALLGAVSHTQLGDGGGCDHGHHGPGDESAFLHALEHRAEDVFAVFASLIAPLVRAAPMDRLGDRVRIEPRLVLHAVLQLGVALPLVLGVPGAAAFRRREIP